MSESSDLWKAIPHRNLSERHGMPFTVKILPSGHSIGEFPTGLTVSKVGFSAVRFIPFEKVNEDQELRGLGITAEIIE